MIILKLPTHWEPISKNMIYPNQKGAHKIDKSKSSTYSYLKRIVLLPLDIRLSSVMIWCSITFLSLLSHFQQLLRSINSLKSLMGDVFSWSRRRRRLIFFVLDLLRRHFYFIRSRKVFMRKQTPRETHQRKYRCRYTRIDTYRHTSWYMSTNNNRTCKVKRKLLARAEESKNRFETRCKE